MSRHPCAWDHIILTVRCAHEIPFRTLIKPIVIVKGAKETPKKEKKIALHGQIRFHKLLLFLSHVVTWRVNKRGTFFCFSFLFFWVLLNQPFDLRLGLREKQANHGNWSIGDFNMHADLSPSFNGGFEGQLFQILMMRFYRLFSARIRGCFLNKKASCWQPDKAALVGYFGEWQDGFSLVMFNHTSLSLFYERSIINMMLFSKWLLVSLILVHDQKAFPSSTVMLRHRLTNGFHKKKIPIIDFSRNKHIEDKIVFSFLNALITQITRKAVDWNDGFSLSRSRELVSMEPY